jgi:glucokinase
LKYVVAVDVGATNLRVGTYWVDGRLIKSVSVRTPGSGGPDTIAECIYDLASRLISELGLNQHQLAGVGVGSIGPLDIRRGEVVNTPNLGIRSFRLRKPLTEFFKTEYVLVVNDCVAGVWGEKVFGYGVNIDNLVYITLSTGVGGGVVVDGDLLIGKDGNAHEVGHIVVRYDGFRCGCGGLGHWEAYASGSGIPRYVKYYVENIATSRKTKLTEFVRESSITPELFFKLVREGDEVAVEIYNELCRVNAAGFASVINVYDPELVVVGGSLALANYDLIIQPLHDLLTNYVVNRLPKILPTQFGGEAVLKGAAALVIRPPKKLLRIYGLTTNLFTDS